MNKSSFLLQLSERTLKVSIHALREEFWQATDQPRNWIQSQRSALTINTRNGGSVQVRSVTSWMMKGNFLEENGPTLSLSIRILDVTTEYVLCFEDKGLIIGCRIASTTRQDVQAVRVPRYDLLLNPRPLFDLIAVKSQRPSAHYTENLVFYEWKLP